MRKLITALLSAALLVGVLAAPAAATEKDDANFVDFVVEQAETRRGNFNIISNVVLALVESGDLDGDDVAALGSAEITAFLPADLAFRRLAADLQGMPWWMVRERDVIPFLAAELGLPTIAEVVKYHIYAGGKVDYRTALSLDADPRRGTDVAIESTTAVSSASTGAPDSSS